jgi:hypothetical protein
MVFQGKDLNTPLHIYVLVVKMKNILKNEENEENEDMDFPWGRENPKIFASYLWIISRRTGEVVSMKSRDYFLSDLKHYTEFTVGNILDFDYYKDVFDFSYRYAEIKDDDENYIMKISIVEIINGKKRVRSYTKKFKKEFLKIFP